MESGGEHTREYLTLKRNISHIINSLAAQIDPGLFAQELWEKGLVSTYVVQKASAREVLVSHRIQDVLQAVLALISLEPLKYCVFIRILKRVHPLLADKLTEFFGASSSEQPEGGCEVDRGATGGTDTRVQPLATMSASAEVRTLTKEESRDLSEEFAFMISKLYPLMDKAAEVEAIKLFLLHYCDVKTMLPYVEPSIYQHCTSTAELLKALFKQRRFHAIQLGLLGTIVGRYGCGESKRLLQEYESKIPKSAPLKRLRNELTDEEIQSSYATKRLKVEINGDSETVCLEDVERSQEALERSSGVSQDVIVFAKHEPGSVILTFIVPECTVESFTDISKSERKLSDLATMGILSIKIDQVTIHTKAHLVHQKLQDLSLEEQEDAHPTPLKPSTLKPTPSSEGTDSGGVGDPTLPKKEIDPAVRRLLQEQKRAQAMKLKPHPVGSPFEETLLPGMSGEEADIYLQQLALRKEKLPQFTHPSSTPAKLPRFTHPSSTPAVEKSVMSKLWSTGSSLEGGTDDPIQRRDYQPTPGDRKAMSLAEKMLLNTTHPSEVLWYCEISPDGVKAIAEALCTNTSLKSLGLSHCTISPEGAEAIAEGLRTNTSLKTLKLRINKVGDDGVQQLAESLRTNKTLEDLDLIANHISSKGAASLAGCLRTNTSLKRLNLWGNEVGDDGVQQLAESLSTNTTLEYLDLSSNHISSKGAASLALCLRTNTSLKTLHLFDNEVGDDGVEQLAESLSTNNTLKYLLLRGCPHISEPVKERMRGIALKKAITIDI